MVLPVFFPITSMIFTKTKTAGSGSAPQPVCTPSGRNTRNRPTGHTPRPTASPTTWCYPSSKTQRAISGWARITDSPDLIENENCSGISTAGTGCWITPFIRASFPGAMTGRCSLPEPTAFQWQIPPGSTRHLPSQRFDLPRF